MIMMRGKTKEKTKELVLEKVECAVRVVETLTTKTRVIFKDLDQDKCLEVKYAHDISKDFLEHILYNYVIVYITPKASHVVEVGISNDY